MSSFLKISNQLFLEKVELNRLVSFMKDSGFVQNWLQNTLSYGLVKNKKLDFNFTNFKVETGSNLGTYKINPGLAFDSVANAIINLETLDNLAIPASNIWYWLRIKHRFTTFEQGLVSINANGTVVGVNTLFTQVLRGQPNFPSKIKFYKLDETSATNSLEYEVASVNSDTSLTLLGDIFNAETNLRYSIVGTFTRGYPVPAGDKYPFQFDNFEFELVQEIITETPPPLNLDMEFYIARLQKSSIGAVTIHDKRNQFWKTKADYDLWENVRLQNNLVGVEKVNWNFDLFSPQTENRVYVGWGFRSSNYTIDPSTRKITINAGQGGTLESPSQILPNMFNGWRVYIAGDNVNNFNFEGEYFIVLDTFLQGNPPSIQANIILDRLDPKYFRDNTLNFLSDILIVPDTDEIEFWFSATSTAYKKAEFFFKEPINKAYAIFDLLVYNLSPEYLIQYRFKNNKSYSAWFRLSNDTLGYYDEENFLPNGDLVTSPVKTQLLNSILKLKLKDTSYYNFNLGELLGVNHIPFPLLGLTLENGVNEKHQILTGLATFSQSVFIDLSTENARDGCAFYIDIRSHLNMAGFNLIFRNVHNSVYTNILVVNENYMGLANPLTFMTKPYFVCIYDEDNTVWRITSLQKDGILADISLNTKIEDETANRINADNALEAADNLLQANLDDEITNRIATFNLLSNRLDYYDNYVFDKKIVFGHSTILDLNPPWNNVHSFTAEPNATRRYDIHFSGYYNSDNPKQQIEAIIVINGVQQPNSHRFYSRDLDSFAPHERNVSFHFMWCRDLAPNDVVLIQVKRNYGGSFEVRNWECLFNGISLSVL